MRKWLFSNLAIDERFFLRVTEASRIPNISRNFGKFGALEWLCNRCDNRFLFVKLS